MNWLERNRALVAACLAVFCVYFPGIKSLFSVELLSDSFWGVKVTAVFVLGSAGAGLVSIALFIKGVRSFGIAPLLIPVLVGLFSSLPVDWVVPGGALFDPHGAGLLLALLVSTANVCFCTGASILFLNYSRAGERQALSWVAYSVVFACLTNFLFPGEITLV